MVEAMSCSLPLPLGILPDSAVVVPSGASGSPPFRTGAARLPLHCASPLHPVRHGGLPFLHGGVGGSGQVADDELARNIFPSLPQCFFPLVSEF